MPKFLNVTQCERLESLLTVGREIKRVNNKDQRCIVFQHDDFENVTIYCTERYCKVTTEGPPESYFEDGPDPQVTAPGVETVAEEEQTAIPVLTNDQ